MSKISMVMFDLSGTTVYDDTGVRDCLYKAAEEYHLDTTPDEILLHMGTNKIHLYQFLIARSQGQNIDFKDFEKIQDPQTYDLAKKVFDRYEELMIAHYRTEVREVEGASDTLNVKGINDNDTVQAVRNLTNGFGVDCVLEVAGVPSLIPTGLKCLRTGGRYVEIGNSAPGAEFTYDACDIV